METKRLIIAYEQGQVDEVEACIRASAEPLTLIALDFWAGRALEKKGIELESSLIEYYPLDEDLTPLRDMAEDFAREWYRLPQLSFFTHRGVTIGEALEPAVDNYVQRAVYFMHLAERILDRHPQTREIIVPHSTQTVPPITGGILDLYEIRAPVDAIRFICRSRGVACIELGAEPHYASTTLFVRRTWRHHALTVLNWIVARAVRRRPIKIFASEYWRNIAPFIERMEDAELVLMDRSEIKKTSWRQRLMRRIRFIHPQDVLTPSMRATARARASYFRDEWAGSKAAVSTLVGTLSPRINWWPMVAEGMEYLFSTYAERVVADAEGINHILKREKTNRILLRASMSGRQHHFYTIAKIADSLDIPSIEIQHAGAAFDPHSVHSRLIASYLAAYGELVREIYVRIHHYAADRIRPVGSPRFDPYLKVLHPSPEDRNGRIKALGLDPTRPIVLAAVPGEVTGLALSPYRTSSYDMVAFFRSIRALQAATPDLQIILKFRPGWCTDFYRAYVAELFEKDVAITDGDLFSMLTLCDVGLSGNSTALYETMIAQKPLVLFPWKKIDTHHVAVYKDAAPMVFSDADLIAQVHALLADQNARDENRAQQQRFLAGNYSFDGHASERIAALLREELKIYRD